MTQKRIGLGVFESPRPQNGNKIGWTHPMSRHQEYASLGFWCDMGRMLDDAGFDFLFFADGYGYPMTDDGYANEISVRQGGFAGVESQMIIPALAQVTRNLGLVYTTPTGLDHPIQMAKRLATLDHFTNGRVGLNMVTGSGQDTIAQLFGHDAMRGHELRYSRMREYMDLCLNYWEGCWDDDAVIRDTGAVTYADPDKLRRIEHDGEYYRTKGYLAVEPSPQRTPLLFQAGTSQTGRAFAAKYAECVFVKSDSLSATAEAVADIRHRAELAGRAPDDLKMFCSISITAGATTADAQEFRRSVLAQQTDETVAAVYRNLAGIDLLALDPDRPLTQRADGASLGELNQSDVARYLPQNGEPGPTVREILDDLKGATPSDWVIVGDGAEVADKMEHIVDTTDLDGFMLSPAIDIAELGRFVEYALPELERRGRRDPLHGTTLRERLFGHSRLSPTHPGGAYRFVPGQTTVS
ncbi:NtaA/DmoA family FMN-dependent monooxygenase [Gordonia sp. DT30]|uniref:NtaA/DmoA family FMN-dependent monooxygenase n=1 Tax=unclassified Gordonia (in: high G+C Gram-positive bacteria) TaxID=2657482 RepID=UPI003CF1CFDC